jgi:pimeloyl-ACP methyl ester carboxylesterase
MDYPAMTEDVLRLLDQLQLEQVAVIGHSMGAKVAMWLALQHPERVDRLLAADMAPVCYANRFATIISALRALDTTGLNSRAQTRLLDALENLVLVNYLLQNLAFWDNGYYWRINLEVVSEQIHTLLDFSPLSGQQQFPGPACFVFAERSDYVDQTAMQRMRVLFPHARMRMMAATGHWLYAEKPEEFMQILRECLR